MVARPLLLLASLLAYVIACHGHAFMVSPLSRARVLGKDEYTASAGNGLGAQPFRKNPDGSNLNDQSDVCGDPHQDAGDLNLRGSVTAIQATYAPGSVITVTFRARVNHGGWFGVRLCPTARAGPSQSCFDSFVLINADTGYTRWWITTGSYGTQTDFATRWRLPAGVSCDGGCVLQMHYRTANSCVDSCSVAECGPGYAARNNPITNQFGLSSCNPARTELFRDCADIRITGSSLPPACQQVTGYSVASGVDRSGDDIARGSSIADAARKCNANTNCKGFNSDGWYKRTVTPTQAANGMCLYTKGTDKCAKCNLPSSQGGCKCNSNCDCTTAGTDKCAKCNLPSSQGGCKCNSNCDCN